MFGDIGKTLRLADDPLGAPNFLLALGLSCYTEYWGKLISPSGRSRDAFTAFLKRFDTQYYTPLSAQIYKDIRCGLAHAYMKENKNSVIDAKLDAPHGVMIDATNQNSQRQTKPKC